MQKARLAVTISLEQFSGFVTSAQRACLRHCSYANAEGQIQ